ncbi:hypothetical protein L6164_022463 [Bauhinia variegata]|uniref:Uncharacterized protein n=1 Tax=Bauhinia variegata TaxID=167791 RepID=A0ACB9MGJ5_BAUVA|nr:hypothetical protein L6164_022463 [Bauhinia variegata]
MNNNSNFATPLPGVWQTGVRATRHAHSPPDSDSYEVPVVYRSSRSFQPSHDDWSGALDPRRMVGDRRPSGLYTIPDFLGQQVSRPQRIYIINGATGSGMNPGFRGTVHRSPPRSRGQTNMQAPAEAQDSRSTATSKLKKVVYNPKQQAWRLILYKKNNGAASANNSKEEGEDGLLFVRGRERGRGRIHHPNNIANMTPGEILAGELFRAMEEAFQLRNAAY